MSITITEFEKKTYDYIKEKGGMRVSNLPKMMWGAIPKLKTAGLVETYKKPTTPWASKKHTFVKILEKPRT
jgi:hypothetical protein